MLELNVIYPNYITYHISHIIDITRHCIRKRHSFIMILRTFNYFKENFIYRTTYILSSCVLAAIMYRNIMNF